MHVIVSLAVVTRDSHNMVRLVLVSANLLCVTYLKSFFFFFLVLHSNSILALYCRGLLVNYSERQDDLGVK
jgi:hypothetical protein